MDSEFYNSTISIKDGIIPRDDTEESYLISI